MLEIRTGRLILRRWRDADRVPFARLNADPVVMEHFLRQLTREESDAFLERSDAIEDGFRRIGLKEIVAFTAPANVRSIRVMEKRA